MEVDSQVSRQQGILEMEVDRQVSGQGGILKRENKGKKLILKRSVLLINCILLAIGTCGGPLLLRLYFVHGGKCIWLSSLLQTAAFPVMIVPLLVFYYLRRKNSPQGTKAKPFIITWRLFVGNMVFGIFLGVGNYLYSSGSAILPVSTSSLLFSTQLAFIAGFSFLMVKQKFTSYSINAVVLLIVASLILGIHSSGDRPDGVSNKEYYIGFIKILASALLGGIFLPANELLYKKAKQVMTYSLVIEMQVVISIFASAFSTMGMLVSKNFQVIPKEAKIYEIGEAKYYTVLVLSAIACQFYLLGTVGVIFSASSLFSGIMISFLLPVTEIFGVIFYNEGFTSEKGVALTISLWGFISYFYGEFKQSKNLNKQTRPNTGSTTDDAGVTSLNQEYEIGSRSDRHSTSMRVAPE
ncbi:hypothetical protein GIB67_030317 [Kingdonia uniflora]|uniref:Probable purine permease n=1 Tax=Kingdonia uniflora TaxID=39325 RepID=A0A7J7M6L8_9MAGN|nr:hypothetical protein GIB67_030317 [Kingdonia uniflora]